jgi:two-component system chemotaxis response regulator CheB
MKIRALVIDDSAFMRKLIADILNSDENIEVIDTAKNGKEGIEKIQTCNPDVITLDVEMPIMDGLTALKEMEKLKINVPVLMLSSLTSEGADATIKALEYGAIDFITKPTNIFKLDANEKKNEIIEKVKMASKIKAKTRTLNTNVRVKAEASKKIAKKDKNFSHIVAIGTSTGGPRALQSVIPKFPENLNATYIIVQHMPPGFTKSLADRLNTMSSLSVKEAEHGESLLRGYCYVAPGSKQLKLVKKGADWMIDLSDEEKVSGHCPSVDVLMDTVANVDNKRIVGVMMTGMGADGAIGMKKLRDKRGYTIAQDEKSCVVYGMPKSAVQNDAVDKVVTLEDIAGEVMKQIKA